MPTLNPFLLSQNFSSVSMTCKTIIEYISRKLGAFRYCAECPSSKSTWMEGFPFFFTCQPSTMRMYQGGDCQVAPPKSGDQFPSVVLHLEVNNRAVTDERQEKPMFVQNVELLHGPYGIISPIISLYLCQHQIEETGEGCTSRRRYPVHQRR